MPTVGLGTWKSAPGQVGAAGFVPGPESFRTGSQDGVCVPVLAGEAGGAGSFGLRLQTHRLRGRVRQRAGGGGGPGPEGRTREGEEPVEGGDLGFNRDSSILVQLVSSRVSTVRTCL